MKRFISLLLCLLLPFASLAEGWMNSGDQDAAVGDVLDDTVYDAADSVGDVVNTGAPEEPTEQEMITYSFTPLDVVLVLDSSGSMAATNPQNNKSILSYAQDAAVAFCQTLFAINPASRVAVVGYDSYAYKVADFAGVSSSNQLQAAIRGINYGGSTDIGGGTPHGGYDFWAMNIDTQGRTIWVKRYGGSKDEELCGTIVMDNGHCLLLGSTSSSDGDVMGATGKNKDAWAVCIDETGRIVWQYATGMSGDDAFNTAAIDPADGCCVLAGLCNVSGSNAKALVVKVQK